MARPDGPQRRAAPPGAPQHGVRQGNGDQPGHRGALVLLDAVDDLLVTLVLPSLAAGRLRLTEPAVARAMVAAGDVLT